MANVDTGCAMCDEPLDLGVLILGTEIEMKAVLGLLLLGDRLEHEPRELIGLWSNLELVGIIVADDPPERFEQPAAERHWIVRIDDNLFHSRPMG